MLPWLSSDLIEKPEEDEEAEDEEKRGDQQTSENIYYIQYGGLRFGR
jgi:hypothetical protein